MYRLSLDDLCGVGSSSLCMAESISPSSFTSPTGGRFNLARPGPTFTLKPPWQECVRGVVYAPLVAGLADGCRMSVRATRKQGKARGAQARTSDGGRRRVQQKPHGDGSGKHQ